MALGYRVSTSLVLCHKCPFYRRRSLGRDRWGHHCRDKPASSWRNVRLDRYP
ncbi:hypothetical protein SESBI_13787 [Sesbania bispinosa]|nr:hypothetical protein SESBI_13787 [Sesbania bispinosa]